MCGIAGLIDYRGDQTLDETVAAMVGAIRHRGPDGEGKYVRDNVAIGHARLSIIDPNGGHQPMSTPDDQVHLTYNGEVYNFRELRRELAGKGYKFRTDSDTEVVLFAYEAWGKRCVERFEGMFAFAVADYRKRELFLARDPFGIKPLLYRDDRDSFAFASEFQAFQRLPDWIGEIDLYAIDLYLRYQYIPAPHTAFRKVHKLPAGHRMTVRMGESHQKIERYWEPEFSSKRKIDAASMLDIIDEILRDSVRRHLVSDVPFGALLSGGIDSSLVVGYMSELLSAPVKTFSIGFADEDANELDFARLVARKYGTEHHEEIVEFEALEMLPEIVRHCGEPFGDQSAIPTWAVAKLARTEVPMVLSGDGGDELFAGYHSYAGWKRIQNRHHNPSVPNWKRLARPILRRLRPGRYSPTVNPESITENWLPCIERFSLTTRESLWKPEFRFLCDLPNSALDQAFVAAEGNVDVNRVQRVDLETYLPEDILRKVDIASMRYGLEVRPPILDKQVFRFAASINPKDLYHEHDGYVGKLPLKNLAARKLGDDFAFRRKQGFVMPLDSWIRHNKNNRNALRDRLSHSNAKIAQWFDSDVIDKTILAGQTNNVWLLLVLEEWFQQSTASHISREQAVS